jgi:histidine triad (HIT) family protein
MPSIFSRIITGEISAHIIAENASCLAFLDVFPLVSGHCLVIPKLEIDNIFDVEGDLYLEMFSFSKEIAKAIQKAIPCRKVGIAVIGLEVPHAHIHLIPLNQVGDMNFSNPKMKVSDHELKEVADRIRKFL